MREFYCCCKYFIEYLLLFEIINVLCNGKCFIFLISDFCLKFFVRIIVKL